MSIYVRLVQVMSGCQVSSGYFKLFQVRSGCVWSRQVRSRYVRLGEVHSDHVTL
jgi:hypothetical protein